MNNIRRRFKTLLTSYSEFLLMIDPPKILPPSKPGLLRPSLRPKTPAQRPRETLTNAAADFLPLAPPPAAAIAPAAAAIAPPKGPQLARTAMTVMSSMKAIKAAGGAKPPAAAAAPAAAAQLPEQLAAVAIGEATAADKPAIVSSSAV
jgi:hypothetical protein